MSLFDLIFHPPPHCPRPTPGPPPLGGYQSCLDLKTRSVGLLSDGEYPVLFAGKNVTVYCHQMSSLVPREYVTLPRGEEENYSEIYGLRLVEPRSCPFNGSRNDGCDCVRDARRREGLTVFSRIRVNVTSLKVNSECRGPDKCL